MKGDVCRSRLVCREPKKAKNKDEHFGPEDVFSPMPTSEGVEDVCVHDDDGTRHRWIDGDDVRRWIYTYLTEGYEKN